MQHFVWGILLLPLTGFVANSLITRLNNRAVGVIGSGVVGLAFLCAVVAFAWLHGQSAPTEHYDDIGWTWVVAGQFHLKFGLFLDPLSSFMTLVVTGVGFLIMVYSVGYMAGDAGYRRFFAQMDLFIFTMLLLVLADNYLWLLVGWAGVGLTSYLLIGFYFERPSAVAAARKAFVMNVIGDWGIMIAIFMMFIYFGAVNYTSVFPLAHTLPYNGQVVTLMGLLLLLGAVAKSAQIPLYTWLPDAMEGPTPVSALIHAATMVTAGVYLVARSYPIFQQSSYALHTVAFIGAVGTIYAASMGLANYQLKRILAFSTMSQIAYMFVGVGVAVYSAGMFHLLEHAFFKALLFMAAGAVMHAYHEHSDVDIRVSGGLRERLPFTHAAFLIGVLAIIGFPFFSGFFSKEDIIGAAYSRALHGDSWDWVVWSLTVITSLLTAAYMFRALFLVFYGRPRDEALYRGAHEPALTMRVPMTILMFLSIVGGWLTFPAKWNLVESFLRPTFEEFPVSGPAIAAQPFYPISMAATLIATFIGFGIAYSVYIQHNPAPEAVVARAPGLYRLLLNRYYVDLLYDVLIVRPIKWTALILGRFFEQDIVDFTVDGIPLFVQLLSSRLRLLQTGFVRNYALGILFGAVLVVGYYVVGGR
ncbi:MAG TPA: NADH-quinone oxidoreductase subunit L [Chloroflexota bacterium]